MKKFLIAVGLVILSVLITSAATMAQLPTATILGTVTDSTGAVIPGAMLTARNVDTGQSRIGISGENGAYRFPALPVGAYEVRVELQGFQTSVRSGLTLEVGQEAVVNFTLQAGALQETVNVTSEAPLVNTTSGTLGGLVDQQKMTDLPLNGRNYVDLAMLQPGVTKTQSGGDGGGAVFSINGAPMRSNNYMLDGGLTQSYASIGPAAVDGSTLGVEGIREFRVVTNSLSAEYGMTMGGQMVSVSKGGTNSVHGSLFHFLRNSALDARNFFDTRKPGFQRNNFGGSLGGPVVRDKLFAFGTYEGLRQHVGKTTVDNVIAEGCHGQAGATITSAACPQLAGASSVTISPVIAPLLALYPLPNSPGNQFKFAPPQPDRDDFGQMRLDHILSAKDSWFGRYTITDGEQDTPTAFPLFSTPWLARSQYVTLAENHVFSPSALNTMRFSYDRYNRLLLSASQYSGQDYSFVPGQIVGQILIGGITNFGPTADNQQKLNVFSVSDDLFYSRGPHSWKFGTLINRFQQFINNATSVRGQITFANVATFLQGNPSQDLAVTGSVQRAFDYSTLGFYAQDDWRVRSNLTLNLGLRYEFYTTLQEVHNQSYALRDPVHDTATTQGPPFVDPSFRNFSPRLGFAWDIRGDGKTALRGGAAVLYDIAGVGHTIALVARSTPPVSVQFAQSNPGPLTLPLTFPASAAGKSLFGFDYHLQQPKLAEYNLTLERELPFDMAVIIGYAGSRGSNILQQREGNPAIPQGIKQNGICVPAPAGQIFNFDSPGNNYCWLPNAPFRNPNWPSIILETASGDSWYNALQFSVLKRLSRGLEFHRA